MDIIDDYNSLSRTNLPRHQQNQSQNNKNNDKITLDKNTK